MIAAFSQDTVRVNASEGETSNFNELEVAQDWMLRRLLEDSFFYSNGSLLALSVKATCLHAHITGKALSVKRLCLSLPPDTAQSSVRKVLRRLESDGMIVITEDAEDGRVRLIKPSDELLKRFREFVQKLTHARKIQDIQ